MLAALKLASHYLDVFYSGICNNHQASCQCCSLVLLYFDSLLRELFGLSALYLGVRCSESGNRSQAVAESTANLLFGKPPNQNDSAALKSHVTAAGNLNLGILVSHLHG